MKAGITEQMLDITDLKYSVNGVDILKGITFSVRKGEFVGLIGPNGAGKTTLLKCLNGINRSCGAVRIKGKSLESMSNGQIAREIALMHQSTSVTFPFSVMDIVLTGRYPHLSRTQTEGREDYAIARKYMKYTGTLEFEEKQIMKLSGGERQKVFFAKALAQETDIILLDEPTASLDIAHVEQIFKYSGELCDAGRTVIAAVHDIKLASRYCSRLLLMKEGKVIADGGPEEVLTSENLSFAFGVNALVYRNLITGQLDFHIHGTESDKPRKAVHVIGGGGSASGVMRLLFENGCKVTAGVFAHGDSDIGCADIYGIQYHACRPFSEISDECHKLNVDRIEKADLTILCDMPFGLQNMRNLEAARYATNLVIVEDTDPGGRDFTGGKALEIYKELKKNAVVINTARLHEVL